MLGTSNHTCSPYNLELLYPALRPQGISATFLCIFWIHYKRKKTRGGVPKILTQLVTTEVFLLGQENFVEDIIYPLTSLRLWWDRTTLGEKWFHPSLGRGWLGLRANIQYLTAQDLPKSLWTQFVAKSSTARRPDQPNLNCLWNIQRLV